MDYLLQVIKLSCEVHGRIFTKPQSFTLYPGDALQIQGANGIGKTTLIKTLIGIKTAYSGIINLAVAPLYIAHQHLLHPDLTVRQNLQFLQANACDGQYFAISHLLDRKARELSVGQQQKVSLSRLLHSKAKLWLLDEPMVNLDQDGRQKLKALCLKHLQDGGAAIIVSHDHLDFGAKLCIN